MKMGDKLKAVARYLFRTSRLTPMYKVFRRLARYGVDPRTLDALEMFGCDGEHHTRDIAAVVATLEIWEIGPQYEPILRKRFPKADIKITDSYVEIKRTAKQYNLVVVDNNDVAHNHYEHFDLFPSIFRILTEPAILILNVTPKLKVHPAELLRQRKSFYKAADPTDITFDEMANVYRTLVAQSGWAVEWMFFERRWTFSVRLDPLYYAVLKLKRMDMA
jgi:hypothetical protein